MRILKSKDVRLVKPEYLLSLHEAGEIIPKRQALPEDAFVDFDDAGGEAKAEAIQIICLSYCWLSDDHPDPDGYHLATIAALLKCFMKGSPDKVNARGYMMSRVSASAMAQAGAAARKKLLWDAKKVMLAEDLQNMGDFCFGAGDGRPVGVFMDWTSAYQKELTTAEEKHSFEAYMKHINLWYAHESTIVWALDYPPEVLPRGGKNVKYQKSGWGAFEHRLGQMISPQSAVLNITDETRSLLLAPVLVGSPLVLLLRRRLAVRPKAGAGERATASRSPKGPGTGSGARNADPVRRWAMSSLIECMASRNSRLGSLTDQTAGRITAQMQPYPARPLTPQLHLPLAETLCVPHSVVASIPHRDVGGLYDACVQTQYNANASRAS